MKKLKRGKITEAELDAELHAEGGGDMFADL